jgi:type I restriction enzyme S subunit
VAKVEALLAQVNAARERLAKVPALLKRFRQSVLAAACSGQLTADWREQHGCLPEVSAAEHVVPYDPTGKDDPINVPPIPDSWCYAECKSLCDPERSITYGVIKLGPSVPDGVPTLRSSDVRWLHIDSNSVKRISPAIAGEYQRTFLSGGEVLVTVRGTLGGVAVVPQNMAGWNISREVAMLPLKPRWVPDFFALAIGRQWSQNWLTGVAKGVAYTGVNIADLKRLPVPVPPVTEQQEIVRRVEPLFALADRIEAHLGAAMMRVERLPHAILARAFRGELVPTEAELAAKEGRDYQSVGQLLAQMRDEAAQQKSQKKARSPMPTRRKASMKELDKASVLKAIAAMPADIFAFDDLRARLPGDYDAVRDILFRLLDDPESGIVQVFDKQAKAMRFRREGKQ